MKKYAWVDVQMYQCSECGDMLLRPRFDCITCCQEGNTIVDAGIMPAHEHTDFQTIPGCPVCKNAVYLVGDKFGNKGKFKCHTCGFMGRRVVRDTEDLYDIPF